MPRDKSLVPFDPEPERTIRRNLALQFQKASPTATMSHHPSRAGSVHGSEHGDPRVPDNRGDGTVVAPQPSVMPAVSSSQPQTGYYPSFSQYPYSQGSYPFALPPQYPYGYPQTQFGAGASSSQAIPPGLSSALGGPNPHLVVAGSPVHQPAAP